jgi:hypothetical protein
VPDNLVAKLLEPPPPGIDPAELQAFLAAQAAEAARLAGIEEELARVRAHHELLLREDEELIFLLCQN